MSRYVAVPPSGQKTNTALGKSKCVCKYQKLNKATDRDLQGWKKEGKKCGRKKEIPDWEKLLFK